MGTFDLSNPDAFAFQQKTKPIWDKKSGLPKFSLKGGWEDTSKSGGQNMWKNTGVSFTLAPEKTPNFKVSSSGIKHQIQPKGGIQTTTGYIMKDTLEKGGAQTILGMSKQVDQFGNIVRGKNYANPDFYAYEKSVKKANELDTLSSLTGGLLGKPKPTSGTNKPDPEANQTSDEDKAIMSGKVAERNEIRRQSRRLNFIATMGRDPTVAEANRIQSELGRGAVGYKKVYRGYSKVRFDMQYTKDPNVIIDDYNKKTIVNEWAKVIDPESAKLDPKRTVRVVDKTSGYNKTRYWTHNNRKRAVGAYWVDTSTYKDVLVSEHSSKGDKMDMTYQKIKDVSKKKKDKYETYFNPVDNSDLDNKIAELEEKKKRGPSNTKMQHHIFYRTGGVSGDYAKSIQASNRAHQASHAKSMEELRQKKLEKDFSQFEYYAISDQTFDDYERNKQDLIVAIDDRRSNQKFIIDTIGSDIKTLDKKDRSVSLIPTLESEHKKLDTKATVLKEQVGDYDWQKKISQDSFGTDTIQGDSHISTVLDSYGGKIRGGNYYTQDIGKLIRKTKSYETELESQIKQTKENIKSIDVDETEGLVDYYTDTTDKEYATASKDYLSKSLTLTKKERDELERARKQQVFSENQPVQQYTPQSSRGRPSLKDKSKSSRQYKNTRTRGGKNTLGGLVI